MILVGSREQEILDRARNRKVTAIIHISAPNVDEGASPEQFGVIYQGKMPARPLNTSQMFAQTAQAWQMDDECPVLAERDPQVLAAILEAVTRRMYALNRGDLREIHTDKKRVMFDCDDLVYRASGIPVHLKLDFRKSAEVFEGDLERLPFPKLKEFLHVVYDRLQKIGGTLHSADITHVAAISAIDYYKISTKEYFDRNWHGQGDIIAARGGTPFFGAPPTSKPH
jgi:hypothetical protein